MAGKTTKKAAAKKKTVRKPAKGGKKTAAKRAAAKPTLLAGGNPQIGNEDGQFDETQMAAWVRQTAALPGWVTAQAAKPRKAVATSRETR